MRGQAVGSRSTGRLLERAVGKCPAVDFKIRGVTVSYLLDTGIQVCTMTEFFQGSSVWGGQGCVVYIGVVKDHCH